MSTGWSISRLRRSVWLRYLVPVVTTAAALGVKLLLVPLVTWDVPHLLFFASVITSAVLGGLGPGLLATGIVALCDNYFFMVPYGQFGLGTMAERIRLALFIAECTAICVICARLQAARAAADDSAREARELECRMLEIADTEQRRIGHDLHDGLGQHLTGISLLARRLEHRLAAARSPEVAEATKLSSLARTAVEWTHDLSRSLSPQALETAGLAEALRELAANVESIFKVECTFEQSGNVAGVDLAAAVHLYRIAQEATHNAVRHAKGKHVRIRLEDVGGGIVVRVMDDGVGVTATEPSSDGMGLRIMRYRARMIGATIEVRPREGGGTEIACRYAAGAST